MSKPKGRSVKCGSEKDVGEWENNRIAAALERIAVVLEKMSLPPYILPPYMPPSGTPLNPRPWESPFVCGTPPNHVENTCKAEER